MPTNPLDAHHSEEHIVPWQVLVDTTNLKKQCVRWEWDLFVLHNEIWKATVVRFTWEWDWWKCNGTDAKMLGLRWVYMDLWEQWL